MVDKYLRLQKTVRVLEMCGSIFSERFFIDPREKMSQLSIALCVSLQRGSPKPPQTLRDLRIRSLIKATFKGLAPASVKGIIV